MRAELARLMQAIMRAEQRESMACNAMRVTRWHRYAVVFLLTGRRLAGGGAVEARTTSRGAEVWQISGSPSGARAPLTTSLRSNVTASCAASAVGIATVVNAGRDSRAR